MANHKAPGADGLPTELLKYSVRSGVQILLLLFNLIHANALPKGGGKARWCRHPNKVTS
jgi:hypothetical protein